jgi:phospholipase/lecithinase/hemolysin
MLVDSCTDLEMCLVAVSEKPFCMRLSLTEAKHVDGVFLEKDELHPTPVLHKITGEKCRIIVIAPAWAK